MASFDAPQAPGVLYTEGEGDEGLPDYIREHYGNWTIPAKDSRTYYASVRNYYPDIDGSNYLASQMQITRAITND